MAKITLPALPSGAVERNRPNGSAVTLLIFALDGFFVKLAERVNVDLLQRDGTLAMTGPLELDTYTVATLPTASSYTGSIIYVSDGSAGQKFRGSDGTSWVNLG